MTADVEAAAPFRITAEVISAGQPRYLISAINQLQNWQIHSGDISLIIAPYLSPASREICKNSKVNYLDLVGNVRIVAGNIYIDRAVPYQPPAEKRELKSIFRPRSAEVLRALLRHPGRQWSGKELVDVTGVSAGHVSNVRNALFDRDWAQERSEGWVLSEPDLLLDSWRDVYEPSAEFSRFYTVKRPAEILKTVTELMLWKKEVQPSVVMASFSAAEHMAPYARTGTQYFYCMDQQTVRELISLLDLSFNAEGGNVAIAIPSDPGIFRDAIREPSGIVYTSPLQTYLDMSVAGERGQEAAEHLRIEKLVW
ncbi:type IV toxin-antitoxin system AbiEi family antitoxin [Herbaspirillum sp. RV1423]|uniref:type IV toxin-antitoxin system AbiEi family antitoxin n=1 Tax=Herbaspirillum sp. RV1423 TaxID=1443993 RepID=UPI0018CC4512|nr:type IV toxin-antitoxin system AbiEi family antitoxin [Herbaspirillum sp. RV1423]